MTGHMRGDGYVNLSLSVLAKSKIGRIKLWKDFRRKYNNRDSNNVDPFDLACWVGSWLHKEYHRVNPGIRCKIKGGIYGNYEQADPEIQRESMRSL